MGNSQDKPPGSGAGLAGAPEQRAAGGKARNGGGAGKPQSRSPPEKGLVNGREPSATIDTSYLDAPAGALPPHLARLKNEGNHLFRHGQFADALEKYSRAIESFPGAGGRLDFFSASCFRGDLLTHCRLPNPCDPVFQENRHFWEPTVSQINKSPVSLENKMSIS